MTDINSQQEQDHGSFTSGLIIGFLVGAVGYFLSTTHEGKQMREGIVGKWHATRKKLVKEGKLSQTDNEITDYIRAARAKISEFLGENLNDTSSKKTKKKASKPRKKRLFKGI